MSKTLEVRMYTRNSQAGLTQLFFLDEVGEPRVVAELEPGALDIAIQHGRRIHDSGPPPLPPAAEPPPRRTRRTWSMEHLLRRASQEPPKQELPPPLPPIEAAEEAQPLPEPPTLDDTMRRRAAKNAVRRAAAEACEIDAEDLVRYDLALQAHNGNVSVMEMFEPEAKASRLSIKDLAERIMSERRRKERRMLHVRVIRDSALADIEQATGEAIGAVEHTAVEKIRGA